MIVSSRSDRVRPEILIPYSGHPKSPGWRWAGIWLFVCLGLGCVLYGMSFALLAPYLILPLVIPLTILGLLVIWALPQAASVPTRSITTLFYAFVVALIMWPNYLALSLPGLPWITVIRIASFPMVVLLLISVSVSADFRTRLSLAVTSVPGLWKLLVGFAVIQLISIAFSHDKGLSIQKFIVAQVDWTAIFFVSAYVFMREGRAARFGVLLWIMGVIVCLMALYEARIGRVPWAGHVPSFLQVNDPNVATILAGGSRGADGVYRVQGTFSTSLGLSEYLALVTPFVLQFLFGRYSAATKLAATLTVALFFRVILLTDSRLGVVGFFLSLLLFPLCAAILHWRRSKASLVAPAVVLSYPVAFVLAVASTFLEGRIHALVWGRSGAAQASTDARIAQYHLGIPKVLGHPWGYGMGMGADALGWVNPAGVESIDTYFLDAALEYGIIGFLLFFGMILLTIRESGRNALKSEGAGADFACFVPIMIAMVNFLVIKSVFAEQDNHPLVFILMGMTAALAYRLKNRPGAQIAPPRAAGA